MDSAFHFMCPRYSGTQPPSPLSQMFLAMGNLYMNPGISTFLPKGSKYIKEQHFILRYSIILLGIINPNGSEMN